MTFQNYHQYPRSLIMEFHPQQNSSNKLHHVVIIYIPFFVIHRYPLIISRCDYDHNDRLVRNVRWFPLFYKGFLTVDPSLQPIIGIKSSGIFYSLGFCRFQNFFTSLCPDKLTIMTRLEEFAQIRTPRSCLRRTKLKWKSSPPCSGAVFR